MSETGKPTGGPATVHGLDVESGNRRTIATCCWGTWERSEAAANANLIADAFNVYHETGLSPRQLAEQRKELLEAAEAALAHVVELRDAWQRGAISESDGKGGTRSNRNVDVEVALREAIAKATATEESR